MNGFEKEARSFEEDLDKADELQDNIMKSLLELEVIVRSLTDRQTVFNIFESIHDGLNALGEWSTSIRKIIS